MAATPAQYDYIIVGAGSAGCALAYRLSRESSRRVLLLEAGGKDSFPMIHIPLGFAFMMKNPKVNWCYETEPEANMHGRRMSWPRGKVLGGTSCINGMVYIRGQRQDYDHWSALGNNGWSYDEVLPYFKRSEHREQGRNDYHGYGGPLWVSEVANEDKLAMAETFVEAAIQSGLPYNDDFNGTQQEGAGFYQLNIRRGKRQSTARTFLKQCRDRPNLVIETRALCHKVLIENGRAVGVVYSQRKGKGKGKESTEHIALASAETVLCGGVINSPQLLELSGVGNPELLEGLGIDVVQPLPGVGENVQDHLTVNVQQGVEGLRTFYQETRPLAMIGNLFNYLLRGKGLLAHPASQVGVFFRSNDSEQTPDAQVHFAPAASETDSKGNMTSMPGTTATVCHLRPASRGSVHIRSADPQQAPRIRANYLDSDKDRSALIAAVRRVRQIFQAPALKKHLTDEFKPGSDYQSDAQILAYIRAEAESIYHPVGSCKMGSDDMAVVDSRLRVHGIDSLRVADASIMPCITSGNTHAPAVMIAEKCADMLLQDAEDRRPGSVALETQAKSKLPQHTAAAESATAE